MHVPVPLERLLIGSPVFVDLDVKGEEDAAVEKLFQLEPRHCAHLFELAALLANEDGLVRVLRHDDDG